MENKKWGAKKVIIVLIIAVTAAALFFAAQFTKKAVIESGYDDEINSPNTYAKDVTMIELLANPAKYDGKLVRVIGVGNLEFEGNSLSLSKDDLKYATGNDIWLALGERALPYDEAVAFNGEYVIVEGIFDKDDHGHMDLYRGAIKDINRYELWDFWKMRFYRITQTASGVYDYQILDLNGNILLAEEGISGCPEITISNNDIAQVMLQTGTGLSTNWAKYCDIMDGRVSETFHYVLGARGEYVVFVEYENNQHSIVVQNMFDKSAYYEAYPLDDASPVAADIVSDFKLEERGDAVITYYKGADYTETEITVEMP